MRSTRCIKNCSPTLCLIKFIASFPILCTLPVAAGRKCVRPLQPHSKQPHLLPAIPSKGRQSASALGRLFPGLSMEKWLLLECTQEALKWQPPKQGRPGLDVMLTQSSGGLQAHSPLPARCQALSKVPPPQLSLKPFRCWCPTTACRFTRRPSQYVASRP